MSLKFVPFLPTGNGILSRDELIFFYYDIVTQNEDSRILGCEWNQGIQDFVNSQGLDIQVFTSKTLVEKFENNTICYFKRKVEPEVMAFFRHLRNAFAHLQIQKYGDYLYIKDIDQQNKVTMIGKVKFEDLRDLCFVIFKQNETK